MLDSRQELCRWLAFAALRETYGDNPEVLDQAMEFVGADLVDLFTHGIALSFGETTQTLRLAVCGIKGDWPFLIESGRLSRHFRRAPKRGESQMQAAGICHLCVAGFEGYPPEDFSNHPNFERTMNSAAELWLQCN